MARGDNFGWGHVLDNSNANAKRLLEAPEAERWKDDHDALGDRRAKASMVARGSRWLSRNTLNALR